MKKVISFQMLVILILAFLWALGPLGWMPAWLADYQLAISCILIAALAGVLYCIRAVYVNYCVNKNWDERWEVWCNHALMETETTKVSNRRCSMHLSYRTRLSKALPIKRALLPMVKRSRLVLTMPFVKRVRLE